MTSAHTLLQRIRILTVLFMVGLVISGATAIPLEHELDAVAHILGLSDTDAASPPASGLIHWILTVRTALHETNAKYPFVAYGFDWLAFGHFAIAIAFLGVLRDPVRNIWLFQFGMIACALVIPYALFFGAIRGIPLYWRFIDCSFGVFGIIPLWLCHGWVAKLDQRN